MAGVAIDPGDLRPQELWGELYSSFLRGKERAESSPVYNLMVAHRRIRLEFAGTGLVQHVIPALRHHLVDPSGEAPELTIFVGDTVSTGIPSPPLQLVDGDTINRGEIQAFNTDRFRLMKQFDVGTVSMLNQEEKTAIFWVEDPRSVDHRAHAPLIYLFEWIFEGTAGQLLHSGAVGVDGDGVMLIGRGGSGKSTTALLCLTSGMQFASDDYLCLSTEPELRGWGLFGAAALNEDSLQRLPQLRPCVSNLERPPGDKALVFLNQQFSHLLVPSLRIKAVVHPRVTDREDTTLVRIAPAQALLGFAPSSIWQIPRPNQATYRITSQLVSQVPSYRLLIGKNSGSIPDLLSDLCRADIVGGAP